MDILKKLWPFSFINKKDVAALVINIIIHVVGLIIVGAVCWLLGLLPLIGGLLAWIIGSVGELYLVGGIVFAILHYCKVLK